MDIFKNNKLVAGLLVFLFISHSFILLYFTEGTYDSGDGVMHYLISKVAFAHPIHYLHHWGKPVFILLSSPFASLGFVWINLYNILCVTASGFFAYLIAEKTGKKGSVVVMLFTWFMPLLYAVQFSGLTEPTFALIISSGIYLLVCDRLKGAFIVLSFLPFARTEGFFVLSCFGLWALFYRKYTIIPLLGTGTLLYSIAGYFAFNDFLWIWHQNPYNGRHNNYGSGSFFHFFKQNERILGTPLVILFIAGNLSVLFNFKKENKAQKISELLLIYGGFWVYLLLHVIFWWRGIFGALGLLRVMAAVAPLSAIICLNGGNFIIEKVRLMVNDKILMPLKWMYLLWVLYIPFKQYSVPLGLNTDQFVLKTSANWINDHYTMDRKIAVGYPFMHLFLNTDPFDYTKCIELHGIDKNHPENTFKKGDLVVWDSHFGTESMRPLELFLSSPGFKSVYSYSEKEGDRIFSVYVFERL